MLACSAAEAREQKELYRGQTIVTGQGEANRRVGFASCLDDVVVKLSGLLRLAGDRRLAVHKANAASLVSDYGYRDEKGGKPKNDEQGTREQNRDRPQAARPLIIAFGALLLAWPTSWLLREISRRSRLALSLLAVPMLMPALAITTSGRPWLARQAAPMCTIASVSQTSAL